MTIAMYRSLFLHPESMHLRSGAECCLRLRGERPRMALLPDDRVQYTYSPRVPETNFFASSSTKINLEIIATSFTRGDATRAFRFHRLQQRRPQPMHTHRVTGNKETRLPLSAQLQKCFVNCRLSVSRVHGIPRRREFSSMDTSR